MPLEGTGASEQRREVGAVEMHAPWFVDADQTTQSREKIDDSSRFVLDASAGIPPFQWKMPGTRCPPSKSDPFLASQFTVSLLQVAAVVGSVDNDGVVELAEFFEPGNESPDGPIRIVDGATVDRGPFVERAILGNDVVGRRDRVVGFIEPEIKEEGFVAVALLIDPGEGFVNDDLAGIAFHRPHAFAIAQEVGWVLVTLSRAVDDAEPVVEAMIGRGGILAILNGHAEVPLAKVSRGVTVFLEHFGDGCFARQEVHPVKAFVEDGIDSGAMVVAAREKSGSRGRAGRGSRVKVGEAHATGGQLVEDGRLDRTVVAADVAVAKIVDVERDDIRRLVSGKTGANQKYGK